MYHKSIYNYIYKKNENEWVIYNTFSGSIVLFNDDFMNKFNSLDNDNVKNTSSFVDDLIKQGILVDNKYDEKQLVDAGRTRRAYGEKATYLRILTTTACNARCSYCYEKGFKTQTMTIETANALVKFILSMPKLDIFYIHWFGGEPLLNYKVIDAVMDKIYDKLITQGTKVFVYFTSNGSLLDKNLVEKAKEKWHANYFQITIDGIDEEYNLIKNYVNSKYYYKRVINNINMLMEKSIKVILRINYLPNEVEKVKNIIDQLSHIFKKYITKKLIVFDPAPIFGNKMTCSNCEKVYNMAEPAKYLVEKNLLDIDDALNLKFKAGQCYACHQGSFVVSPIGNLYKCTTTMNDKDAIVGNIYDGVDRNKFYFKWVNPNLPKMCNKCIFLPLCQGGCRAGELGYLSVFCKRNLSEIQDMLNYKIDYILKNNITNK